MAIPKFPELEEKILEFWRKKNIFQKTLKARANAPRYVFYEGPPTANGKPGLHHVLARAFKDLFPRYKTMRGFLVERRAGWDTHGLPVELQVEKELGLKNKKEIEAYGVAAFNKQCKESVWRYKEDWEKLTERIAFWLDLEHPYITYENDYIESVWWVFKQIWDKGLVYRDYKVVPYCTRCGTALSSHEVAQGYKDITEPSVFVKFRLTDEPNTFILAWTTTPWTLPGNVALAVGDEIDYVKISVNNGPSLILAKDRLEIIDEPYKIIEAFKGKKLEGREYEPLYPVIPLGDKHAYFIALAPFVSTTEGTGVVHTAVMYGEDDFQLGQQLNLPKFHTVDAEGKFRTEVVNWAGQYVKDAEAGIREDLAKRGLLYKTVDHTHSYPFCWRCDTPLLYYAKGSWFIKTTAVKKKLLSNNETINWVPSHIKYGRFGEWLAGVKDWAISRERYWGAPLPIWQCQDCRAYRCLGSRQELGVALDDLHRPYIDEVELTCNCGGQMKRVKELFDVWFDSGAMPFAQWHYPFANQEKINSGAWYPADYIAEAIDQTRGWFYTLLAVATLLDKAAPYRQVICLGHINDAQGQKMSKSKGNIVDPWTVINAHGADALRWHLFTINQPGESKNFDIKSVAEVVRQNFILLWNIYAFYEMFKGGQKIADELSSEHVLDRWLMAKTQELIKTVTVKLDQYDVLAAARPITDFINDFSVWYVRRSRGRVKSKNESDKLATLSAMRYALLNLSKLLAPFTPMLAEELYQRLDGGVESVHLADWPAVNDEWLSAEVLSQMKQVRKLIELGLAARAEAGVKIRQPLPAVSYRLNDLPQGLGGELESLIKDELNVKEVSSVSIITAQPGWQTKEEAGLSVALNTNLTPELLAEGWVRELIRQVNSLRKEASLTLTDQIVVYYQTSDDKIKEVIQQNLPRLQKETISRAWQAGETTKPTRKTLKLKDQNVVLSI